MTQARQLILLCDGTNNNLTGGAKDTHVLRLAELLAADPDEERLVCYDPGVGHAATLPSGTAWDALKLWRERVEGLALGKGVFDNISEGYRFLVEHYRPGDQIFCLGFSRGAFTARSIAGMVNQFGLLGPAHLNMLPTLLHLYFAERSQALDFELVCAQAQVLFVPPARRGLPLHFVGTWDTVASVGLWPFGLRFSAKPVAGGKSFVHVRQALSLDEHRAPFEPRLYEDENGPLTTRNGSPGSIQQRWFRGAHADVGGGYEKQLGAASDAALAWMLAEAVQCGLRLRHQGQLLDNEALALQVIGRPDRQALLHDELSDNAAWALGGLRVREANEGSEHTSVAERTPAWPADTAWRAPRRSRRLLWAAIALMPLLIAWQGLLITGFGRGGAPDGFDHLLRYFCDILIAPMQVGMHGLLGTPAWLGKPAPLAALWVDTLFIAAYASVAARAVARGFSRAAGLRRVSDPPAPWLNRLGRALPLMVAADLLENLLLAGAHAFADGGMDWASPLLRILAAGAGVAKFVGLAGVLLLAVLPPTAPRRASSGPGR